MNTEEPSMTPIDKANVLMRVKAAIAEGVGIGMACRAEGVSVSTFERWSSRHASGGMDGLEDLPRSGRPPQVSLTEEEAGVLRRTFLRSNLREGAGSMTASARWAARDENNALRPEVRAAILKVRASKHLIPVEVRRALRASEAEVKRYRDPKSGQNDGIYTPGWLRMATDGTRRLEPGERQVWDDASVNVGVTVPWARGGDRCSDRWGCRVARFQLLACLDCAGDFAPGYSYVMRQSDAYAAADVAGALWRVWTLNGYAPHECVMEGGAWQSRRVLDFCRAAGVQVISAKGRPNQKLVEGWFNRLWTVLSIALPPHGQVGRFRGEMDAENVQWRRCREGIADPREHFPLLTEFLRCLDKSINYLNSETIESREYGTWTPCERYAAQAVKGHPLPQGLRRYALPVRETRKIDRQGMAGVRADSPFGWPHDYLFASEQAAGFVGALVTVSFDPHDIGAGATLELAEGWRDMKAGRVIDEAAVCVSPAPELTRTQGGFYVFGARDARAEAKAEKKASRALVGAQVAAFDERGVKARHGEMELQGNGLEGIGKKVQQYGFGQAARPAVETEDFEIAPKKIVDWAAMEAAAGVMVS
jgi:hypothetical protein